MSGYLDKRAVGGKMTKKTKKELLHGGGAGIKGGYGASGSGVSNCRSKEIKIEVEKINNEWLVSQDLGIKVKPCSGLITVNMTKKELLETYTLRARIGIYIGVILGLVTLKLRKE